MPAQVGLAVDGVEDSYDSQAACTDPMPANKLSAARCWQLSPNPGATISSLPCSGSRLLHSLKVVRTVQAHAILILRNSHRNFFIYN